MAAAAAVAVSAAFAGFGGVITNDYSWVRGTHYRLSDDAAKTARELGYGKRETMLATAMRMLKDGVLALKDIARYSGLSLCVDLRVFCKLATTEGVLSSCVGIPMPPP